YKLFYLSPSSAGGFNHHHSNHTLLYHRHRGEKSDLVIYTCTPSEPLAPFGVAGSQSLTQPHKYVLRRLLPKNAHLLATGRLFVSMTRIPDGRNVLVSEFHSREDVIQALLCSCFLPLYCGIQPPCYKGVYYIDGGFTDILPVPGSSRTLTVSPFAGEVDICPRDPNAGGYAVVLSGLVFHFSLPNCTRMTKALFPPAPSVRSSLPAMSLR
uniref:PNPLA domain-containing protein n=1 Tax=Scleropages formosus TaxID=113540 RepID=A0A8C9SM81_SCLFO